MAATATPGVGRRITKGNKVAYEIPYIISGAANATDAETALLATAPTTWEGYPRDNYTLSDDGDDASGILTATVQYQYPDTSSEAFQSNASFAFSTAGGKQHITQSLSTVASYPTGARDFKGAIAVDDKKADGVDITAPQYEFSETRFVASSTVTDAYKGKLFALTGTVNDAAFRGLAAGECLFLGAEGTEEKAGGKWKITYHFAGSPNRTGIVIGDITGINADGWDYIWVYYDRQEDATAKSVVLRPRSVYVERVYARKCFADLGI